MDIDILPLQEAAALLDDGDMTRTVAEPGDKPHKGDADNEDPMTRKDKLR